MQLYESFRLSVDSIVAHKMRSSLTLLGVVIGVMTIISTMSVIKGLQNLMEDELSMLSAGVFQVQRDDPGGFDDGPRDRRWRPKLTMREYRALAEHMTMAEVVAPEVWTGRGLARYENEATPPNLSLCGGGIGTDQNNSWVIESGRYLNEQDIQYARDVCVIGSYVRQRLFPFRDPVGEHIVVNGQRLRVIGTFEERGAIFNSWNDYLVVVPITSFADYWGIERSWIITVRAKDPSKMDETIEQAITIMRSARGLSPGEPNNFGIFNSEALVESFNDFTKFIRIAAFGIASIALLVAGVGIMNIMLVSVTERTREIGIRKALGAKRLSILWQFLVEAVILTEIGALIGVGIGVASSLLLGTAANIPVAIPPWSIGVGILFCSIIGLVFGTWPAWKAARLDPIVALRYE